jgi:RNA polymerase sigma-70 factor (ECF subfamily)
MNAITPTPTHKLISSQQLLEQLAAGEAAAWTELLERFGAQILNVSRRILNDEALAEDAVQESLLLIRDNASRFRPEGAGAEVEAAAGRWIVRIACTTSLQMLRKSRQTAKREAAYSKLQSSTAPAEPSTRAESAEEAALVRRELAQLPEDYRLPITLHFLGGLTFPDIAAELRCPVGTAKTNVHRGLERLRKRVALFGLLLPLSEMTGNLQRVGPPPAVPSAHQLAHWQTLLKSSAKPAYAMAATKGGLSIMAKSAIGLTAAALLTSVAVTFTTARTAEQKPTSPTAPAVPVKLAAPAAAQFSFAADPNDPAWVLGIKKKLQRTVTFDFRKTTLDESISTFQTLSGVSIVALSDALRNAPLLTYKADNEPLATALEHMLANSKLECTVKFGVLVIGDAEDLKIVEASRLEVSPALTSKLERQVTFEFVDLYMADAIKFLSVLTKVPMKVDEAVLKRTVTFRSSELELRNVLLWLALLSGAEVSEKDGTIAINASKTTIKLPTTARAMPQEDVAREPKAPTSGGPEPDKKSDKAKDEF